MNTNDSEQTPREVEINEVEERIKCILEWACTHPKSPWVNVKDDLPKQNVKVLLRYKGGGMVIGELSTDLGHVHWLTEDDGLMAEFEWVDYWMPIPELPK